MTLLINVVLKEKLLQTKITNFITESDVICPELILSYQLFGQPLGSAPVVLVNHALTGNSNVTGDSGWWSDLIGEDKNY